jgi:hypothetical protein
LDGLVHKGILSDICPLPPVPERMMLRGCEMWNIFIRVRVGISDSVLWTNNETLGSVE